MLLNMIGPILYEKLCAICIKKAIEGLPLINIVLQLK